MVNIDDLAEDIRNRLKEEEEKIKRQSVIVEELATKYTEQAVVLKVMKDNAYSMRKCLEEIGQIRPLNKTCKVTNNKQSDQYDEFKEILNKAADIAVREGVILERVATKKGGTQSVRSSLVNRAYQCIARDSDREVSLKDWLIGMTKEEISSLRNAGTKTVKLLLIAQDMIKKGE